MGKLKMASTVQITAVVFAACVIMAGTGCTAGSGQLQEMQVVNVKHYPGDGDWPERRVLSTSEKKDGNDAYFVYFQRGEGPYLEEGMKISFSENLDGVAKPNKVYHEGTEYVGYIRKIDIGEIEE